MAPSACALLDAGRQVRAVVRDKAGRFMAIAWMRGRCCRHFRCRSTGRGARGRRRHIYPFAAHFRSSARLLRRQGDHRRDQEGAPAIGRSQALVLSTVAQTHNDLTCSTACVSLKVPLRISRRPSSFSARPGSWRRHLGCVLCAGPRRDPQLSAAAYRPVPMIATEDVGRMAASLQQANWAGHQVVEWRLGAHFAQRNRGGLQQGAQPHSQS